MPVSERKNPGMWVDPEDDPRDTGAALRGERAVLIDYLQHYRMTLEMKCEGLDAEQLARRSVPPSTLSLLGLVRHLAKVEHTWFRRVMGHRLDLPRLYWSAEDRDLDFNGAVADPAVVEDAWASLAARGRARPRAWSTTRPILDVERDAARTARSSCARCWCT